MMSEIDIDLNDGSCFACGKDVHVCHFHDTKCACKHCRRIKNKW